MIEAAGRGLIVRTSAFFSPLDPHNFAHAVAHTLAAGRVFRAAGDQAVSPTLVCDLVDAALDLVIDGETGIAHLANRGCVSWAVFAVRIAAALGLDADLVQPVAGASLGQAALRPARVELASRYGALLPTLDSAVERYAAAVRPTLKIVAPAAATPPRAARRTKARSFAGAASIRAE